jgi:uncharacterized ferritin-like protein (DUF455 family)
VSLDPRLFADGPARDARFDVRETWAEMTNLPDDDPRAVAEFLHRQMNEEVNGLEIAARNLTDFPDADWELRMAIARQCWDEARHVVMFRRCFEARGGTVGQYPVLNFQYRIATRIGSLLARLAVQNRSFEAAGIDAIQDGMTQTTEPDLRALLDGQLADEIQHVRFANEWMPELTRRGGARATFELARAVGQADEALAVIAGGAVTRYPVQVELRREAGFDESEIAAVKESSGRS